MKRVQLALALLVVAVATLAISQARIDHEPIYRGRALSVWLQAYDPASRHGRGSPQWNEADKAVRQIGDKSIPLLLRMLRAKDSKLKLEAIALAQRQNVVRVHFVPAGVRNTEASRAFVALGEAAKDAVPRLMEIYTEHISLQSMNATEEALGWIGPAAKSAIPLLLEAATNSNNKVMASALWALGEIHAEPQLCIPELIRGLNDRDAWTQISAAHALGMFGADAQAAVPALTQLANSTNSTRAVIITGFQVRFEASRALHKISPDPLVSDRQPEFELGIPTGGSLFSVP